jgi:tetratricopeptide (TPR) repeat protein
VYIRTSFGCYLGHYSGFYYRWPVVRDRVTYYADDLTPTVRPLGFGANPGDFDSSPNFRYRWPYDSIGGRDEAPARPARVESEAAVGEGRARWRAGDTAGALESFKKAVSADLKYGPAQLHMALALVAAGDSRNADKAVRSALDILRGADEISALKLEELFRTPKDRTRFEAKLAVGADGTGSLALALAHHLLGRKAKAAALLGALTDPAAARLAALLP